MFDYLEGLLERIDEAQLVVRVETGGGCLAYRCRCPLRTFDRLQEKAGSGAPARVFVLTVSQDDLPRLLGFATREERELCRMFLKVSGVGPSLALALLSSDQPRALLRALRDRDIPFLKSIRGIGAKTAERLALETTDKAAEWLQAMGEGEPFSETAGGGPSPLLRDARAALESLGFSAEESKKRVETTAKKLQDPDLETLVRASLKG
ncbi:MAG TPA: Holliday junction branch migration protein RuvA [Planctomycetes bacterium]|nr:Holliday junction branch migration protein RuvA [Planctomycetota bacterium]